MHIELNHWLAERVVFPAVHAICGAPFGLGFLLSLRSSSPRRAGNGCAASPDAERGGLEIRVDDLSVSFLRESHQPLQVLSHLSFRVAPEESLTVVGPSGCGKTTMLRVLGGLLEDGITAEVSGRIKIDDKIPSFARLACLFGFAFQNPALLPWRTVRRNLQLPYELRGQVNGDHMEEIDDLTDLFGLHGFADSFPVELSGGMQQRVNVARALIHKPPILLMDEPFGALDERTREKINDDFLAILDKGESTVVMVTHSLREAALIGDRVMIMSDRPARARAILQNPFPRPRSSKLYESASFLDFVRSVRFEVDRIEK